MSASLIVALDVAQSNRIGPIVDALPQEVRYYKVGLELYSAEGPAALQPLRQRQRHIFLDLKLHDIPRTVERAVASVAQHGVELLTVHASGGRAMLEAAVNASRAHGPGRPRILAVTVLTSLDRSDLADLGIQRTPADQVLALAELAVRAGVDGLVCSPQELAELRKRVGPEPLLVSPGIRLPSDAVGDQKRVATPGAAVRAGASHLVVGRPILEATDPAAAARAVLNDMAGG